jgi:hypothetical protein
MADTPQNIPLSVSNTFPPIQSFSNNDTTQLDKDRQNIINDANAARETQKLTDNTKKLVAQLADTGKSFNDIQDSLKKAGLSAKQLDEATKGYYKSVQDLLKLTPSEFFGDLKRNLASIGNDLSLSLDLEALYKGIKLLGQGLKALDTAAASVNATMLVAAAATGKFAGASGVGGLFGKPRMTSDGDIIGARTNEVMRILTSRGEGDNAAKMIQMGMTTLPRNLAGVQGANLALSASNASTAFGVDPDMAMSIMSQAVRRSAVDITNVMDTMDLISSTGDAVGMTNQQTAEAMKSLWEATRLVGVSFKDTSDIMKTYGDTMGLVSLEQRTSLEQQSRGLGAGNVGALASLAKQFGVSGADKLFGTSSNPIEQYGTYLQQLKSMPPAAVFKVFNGILDGITKSMLPAGTPTNSALYDGMKATAFKQMIGVAGLSMDLPFAQNLAKQLKIPDGFLPGISAPGSESGGIPHIKNIVKNAMSEYPLVDVAGRHYKSVSKKFFPGQDFREYAPSPEQTKAIHKKYFPQPAEETPVLGALGTNQTSITNAVNSAMNVNQGTMKVMENHLATIANVMLAGTKYDLTVRNVVTVEPKPQSFTDTQHLTRSSKQAAVSVKNKGGN